MLINIATNNIDKTHNIYAASTYMICHDLLMNYSCY